ncbi:MAG TPA: YidC/Oxa1 family membrane protein insertase [bacterium]|nr:YidC/Oxa1 family membrane protein insertase [bacterium]
MNPINAIADVLQQVLQFFTGATGSAGLAIILLTVAIKLVLHPLTRRQLRSMKEMQVLAPQITVLRAKYKDNPQQMNTEVMNLYRAHGVNPLSGCLPMLVQLPVLYGLFNVLRREHIFNGATFLGFPLEAVPTVGHILSDPLLAVFPLLVALTTYLQQRMSVTDPQQAKLFLFMPVLVGYFATQFPVGLSLYWITSTAAYILEYYIVVGRGKSPATALTPAGPIGDGSAPVLPKGPPVLSQRPKGAKKK